MDIQAQIMKCFFLILFHSTNKCCISLSRACVLARFSHEHVFILTTHATHARTQYNNNNNNNNHACIRCAKQKVTLECGFKRHKIVQRWCQHSIVVRNLVVAKAATHVHQKSCASVSLHQSTSSKQFVLLFVLQRWKPHINVIELVLDGNTPCRQLSSIGTPATCSFSDVHAVNQMRLHRSVIMQRERWMCWVCTYLLAYALSPSTKNGG